jgi:hypothetical protein
MNFADIIHPILPEVKRKMSEWNRVRIIMVNEFRGFSCDIAQLVAEYCAELKLLDWIDQDKLDADAFDYGNPRAYEDDISERIHLLTAHTDQMLLYYWRSPVFADDPRSEGREINWKEYSACPSEKAVSKLLENQDKIYWPHFTMNLFAMDWLWKHPDKIVMSHIDANPRAIDTIKSKPTIDVKMLSYNSHPWAIEYLQNHQDEIDWKAFSTNPGIFEYCTNAELVCELTDFGP